MENSNEKKYEISREEVIVPVSVDNNEKIKDWILDGQLIGIETDGEDYDKEHGGK